MTTYDARTVQLFVDGVEVTLAAGSTVDAEPAGVSIEGTQCWNEPVRNRAQRRAEQRRKRR